MGKQLSLSASIARLKELPKLTEKAFDLFRNWTVCARNTYPAWSPEVQNEQDIVNDLRESFEKALTKFLTSKEHWHNNKEYAVGFIGGFVQGILSVDWSIRYLPKPPVYEKVLWSKSLLLYFRAMEEPARQVNRLYTNLKYSNQLFNSDNSEEDAYTEYYHFIADENFDQHRKQLLNYLTELEASTVTQLVHETKNIEPDGFFDIFKEEDIHFMLFGNPS